MGDIAIKVEGLGKEYFLGERTRYKTLRESWKDVFQRGNDQPNSDTLWALKDVSFEVEEGEVVGVIGRNGAGKSTLLKILSRITSPTTGLADINGRVGSLLEVGTGFHPELTGRENIFLNGAILGMTRREVQTKLDEIVSFAEVEKFLETPIKRYSSGMYVRLAFAVAAHLQPDILIVDEVLAVGDVSFQKKCLDKMSDAARSGRTVIFVSHNMGAIRALCARSILIKGGTIVADGNSPTIIRAYLDEIVSNESLSCRKTWRKDEAPGGRNLRLLSVAIVSNSGRTQASFTTEEPISIRCKYEQYEAMEGMRVVIQILTDDGQVAFGTTDQRIRGLRHYGPAVYTSTCHIPQGLMNIGNYTVRVWAGIPGVRRLIEPIDAAMFTVMGISNHDSIYGQEEKWSGAVCPRLQWDVVKEQNST